MKVNGLVIKPGKALEAGDKVEVYYNLQQGGFSILKSGLVVAYAENVYIQDATFHINGNKLAKIRRENRKTVYATIKGIYQHCEPVDNSGHAKGYCNPYTTGKFIDWDSKEELTGAKGVYCYDRFFSFIGGEY